MGRKKSANAATSTEPTAESVANAAGGVQSQSSDASFGNRPEVAGKIGGESTPESDKQERLKQLSAEAARLQKQHAQEFSKANSVRATAQMFLKAEIAHHPEICTSEKAVKEAVARCFDFARWALEETDNQCPYPNEENLLARLNGLQNESDLLTA